MAPLSVPKTGLTLRRTIDPDPAPTNTPPKPPQVMRLNLTSKSTEELLETLLNKGKAQIRFGKNQSLQFRDKTQRLYSYTEHVTSELYMAKEHDKENMYFSGLLSHKLEVEKAKEATAGSEQALATLEQSLNAYKEQQALNTTQFVGSKGKSPLDLRKDHLLSANARSSPSSPFLGASRSPALTPRLGPTSAPLTSVPQSKSKEQVKLDALKVPIIHLLALRPMSAKQLSERTRASRDDCMKVLTKYGVEDDRNKELFKLKEKVYKDLDVWKFPYTEEDRQKAINHAISAFDRQRVPKSDKLWQQLLRKEERGKGIVLSRLNLGQAKATKFDGHLAAEGARGGYATGNETDGGATPKPGSTTPAKTQASIKTVDEKEPQSKVSQSRKPGPRKAEVKKAEKIDQKVPRKTAKSSKAETKFKSAEVVEDSDEEIEKIDAATVAEPIPPKKESQKKAGATASSKADPPQAEKASNHNATLSGSSLSSVQSSESLLSNSRKSAPRPRTDSSPQKPSPLGSSPPTNASEFDNSSQPSRVSSSSSSPYVSQGQRERASSTSNHNRTTNTSSRPQPNSANVPAKRKADHGVSTSADVKRQRPNGVASTSSVVAGNKSTCTNGAYPSTSKPKDSSATTKPLTSTATSNPLKRKAAEPPPSTMSTSKPSTPNGHLPTTNGASTTNLNKRPKTTTTIAKPTSPVPSSNSSSSLSPPPPSFTALRDELNEKSRRFKTYYERYKLMHERITAARSPEQSDIEKLKRMHERVANLKREIWEEDKRLRARGA